VAEGDAPAVRELNGTLLQNVDFVNVECLPLDIPSFIAIDLSSLDSFDISITVADLVAPEGVTILTDPSVSVATVAAPRIRIEGEEAEGDEFAEGEAGADGDGADGGEGATSEESEE
jgi:large subunit ribosomal protein L25